MKRRVLESLSLSVALVAAFGVRAEFKVGDNLLTNGRFEADQSAYPPGWEVYPRDTPFPSWAASGGPGGIPCVTFSNPGGGACDWTFGERGLKIATNGHYRLSAFVRPRNFTAGNFMILVVNAGWSRSGGIRSVAAPEEKWTRVSAEFDGFPSPNGLCNVNIWMKDLTGAIDVADVRLEPLDEAALRGSARKAASVYESEPRIVPWKTLLGEIRRDTREAAFRFLGDLPGGTAADYDLRVTDERTGRGVSRRLDPSLTCVVLPKGLECGVLTASVVRRKDASNVCSRVCRYRVTDVPSEQGLKRHRRLNNLVTEILSAPLPGEGQSANLSFSTARRGWVFMTVPKSSGKDVSVAVDGVTVISADTPRHEAMRLLPRGDHAVVARGAGRLVVRAIPEIFSYAPYLSILPENPPYDWPYQDRYVLQAATTMNAGPVPEEFAPYAARGYAWVDNMNVNAKMTADEMLGRFRRAKGLTEPGYLGTSADELYLGSDEANRRYLECVARYERETRFERSLYTWLINKPRGGNFDVEFLSGCVNAGLGGGKVMLELYARTKETEAEAKAYVSDYILDSMRRYRALDPDLLPSVGAILGNFSQLPNISLAHDPEVDFKAYLDMQVEALATDPSAEGLGAIGYWGSRNCDDEMLRWSFMLMRHYAVNGRTEPLRGKFGLTYRPGHLRNGDFRDGLAPWTAQGDVACDAVKGFGWTGEGRYGTGSTAGDTFAVLTRGKTPNRLSQRATGLVPGRTYCLQCCTFDVADLKEKRCAPRQVELTVSLGKGAERIGALSWHHVDRRKTTSWDKTGNYVRVNLVHLVFRATAKETEVAIDDAGAAEGMRLGVNAVSLNPYVPTDWGRDVEFRTQRGQSR